MKKTKKLTIERTTLRVLKAGADLGKVRGGVAEPDSNVGGRCVTDIYSESSLTTTQRIIRETAVCVSAWDEC
jgi:hypothetical protein